MQFVSNWRVSSLTNHADEIRGKIKDWRKGAAVGYVEQVGTS